MPEAKNLTPFDDEIIKNIGEKIADVFLQSILRDIAENVKEIKQVIPEKMSELIKDLIDLKKAMTN